MTGYEAYKIYLRMKAHFKDEKFDFFKYRKVRASASSYDKRTDRHFFDKLSKKFKAEEEMVSYLVSQLKDNPDMWIGDMFNDDATERHLRRLKTMESLSYRLETDTKLLVNHGKTKQGFNDIFVAPCNGCHPRLLSFLLQRKIAEESFLSYDHVSSFMDDWDEELASDPIWQDMRIRLRKYAAFLSFDKESIRNTIKDILSQHLLTTNR